MSPLECCRCLKIDMGKKTGPAHGPPQSSPHCPKKNDTKQMAENLRNIDWNESVLLFNTTTLTCAVTVSYYWLSMYLLYICDVLYQCRDVKAYVFKHYTANNKTENCFVTLVKWRASQQRVWTNIWSICLFILAAVMLFISRCGQMLHFDGLKTTIFSPYLQHKATCLISDLCCDVCQTISKMRADLKTITAFKLAVSSKSFLCNLNMCTKFTEYYVCHVSVHSSKLQVTIGLSGH